MFVNPLPFRIIGPGMGNDFLNIVIHLLIKENQKELWLLSKLLEYNESINKIYTEVSVYNFYIFDKKIALQMTIPTSFRK